MNAVGLSRRPGNCQVAATSSLETGLWPALSYVATFGDTDRLAAWTVTQLREAGLIAGPAIAPYVTRRACTLLDSRRPMRTGDSRMVGHQ